MIQAGERSRASANSLWLKPSEGQQAGQPLSKRIGGHLALVLLSFVFVMPFAWLLTTSLQPDDARSKVPPPFIPATPAGNTAIQRATGYDLGYTPTLQHYFKGLTRVPVLLFLRNTLFVCTFVVFGTILSSSLVALRLQRPPLARPRCHLLHHARDHDAPRPGDHDPGIHDLAEAGPG